MTFGGDLRPASFGGAGFHVTRDARTAPRALHIDELPKSERYRVTPLGGKARLVHVEAYLGDEADVASRGDALDAAFAREDAALLILPDLAPAMAWLREAERVFERTKLGLLAYRVEFVLDFAPVVAGLSLGAAEALVAAAVSAVAGRAQALVADLSGAPVAQSAAQDALRTAVAALAADAAALGAEDVLAALRPAPATWADFAAVVEALSTSPAEGAVDVLSRAAGGAS